MVRQCARRSYTTEQAVSRVTLTPGEDFASQRTITWLSGETAQPAELLLRAINEKGDTLRPVSFVPTSEVIASRSGRGCYYQVHLDSLISGRSYLYTIRVTGALIPSTGHFAMPSEDRATHFVYMGDVQDPSITESKRYFDYLRHAADSIDFFAFAGDQIEGPTDAYWRAWYTSIGSLTRSIPHHCSTRQPRVPEEGLRARTRSPLGTSVRLPTNGPKDFLGRATSSTCHSLRSSSWTTTVTSWVWALSISIRNGYALPSRARTSLADRPLPPRRRLRA